MNTSASVTALASKRSARITADDVYQAADALLIDGQKPTIQGVRAKLGRGSPNTVQEHLDQWWSRLGQRVMGSPGEPLPLPKPVSDALLQLWSTALREAQHAVRQVIDDRATAAATREADLEQWETRLVARERAVDESSASLKDALQSLRQQNDDQKTRLDAIDIELAAARKDLQDAQARIQHEQAQCRRVQQELQDALAERLRERAESDRHIAATEARALREIDRARQETKAEQRKRSATEKALRADIKKLKDDLKVKFRELAAMQRADRDARSSRAQARPTSPGIRAKRPPPTSSRRARRGRSTQDT